MADRYEDERGVIQDILGPIDSVTHITTKAGAVRGNHIHHKTVQYTWILSGSLFTITERDGVRVPRIYQAGEMMIEEAGVPHAWQAKEDTAVLVFTKGPRSGENYENDTVRLEEPLL